MKIHWNKNPLKTAVKINEKDRERILLYIQSEEYADILCELQLWLKGSIQKEDTPTIEKVEEFISGWGEICNMTTEHEAVKNYEQYLLGSHGGDCTCLPASCAKCRAEEALGIDTIEGLGKHSAYKIFNVFHKLGEDASINDVIAKLETIPEYQKPNKWPDEVDYEKHIPRWKEERNAAAKWLREYKEKHFDEKN